MDPKGFMNQTLCYLGSLVNGISGGLQVVNSIGEVSLDSIHFPTCSMQQGERKPLFRAGNLRASGPPEMAVSRWIGDHGPMVEIE